MKKSSTSAGSFGAGRCGIDEALKLSKGNQVAASEFLCLHRTTLRNKLKLSRVNVAKLYTQKNIAPST